MEVNVNLEYVIALITILGACFAILKHYGQQKSDYAVIQLTLTNINKEVVEIKTIIKDYEEEMSLMRVKMAEIEARTNPLIIDLMI